MIRISIRHSISVLPYSVSALVLSCVWKDRCLNLLFFVQDLLITISHGEIFRIFVDFDLLYNNPYIKIFLLHFFIFYYLYSKSYRQYRTLSFPFLCHSSHIQLPITYKIHVYTCIFSGNVSVNYLRTVPGS